MEGTGSGFFFPMVDFGIRGVESSGSATKKLIHKVDGKCICCGIGRWIELA
jgi:hypothetical protein